MLTPEALDLVEALEREFGGRRLELLQARAERQKRISAGELPDFLEETRSSAKATGRSLPYPPTCRTGESRSPGPQATGRW